MLLVGCSGRSGYQFPSVQTLYTSYLAELDIKKEKHEDALSKYYSILEDNSERAEIHSNIGVLLNTMQKSEDSLKSLEHALKLAKDQSNLEMIFKVYYNLAVYYGAQKKIPEALANYQAALDIVPTSNEIKTNIELLLQQQQQKQQDQQGQNNQNKQDKQNEQQKDESDPSADDKEEKNKKNEQKRENSPQYQPRPFKEDQLLERDVKKILSELRNQEQKIMANFGKKEKKGTSKKNEKDW